MPAKIDLTGQKFHMLTVLREELPPHRSPSGQTTRRWLCKCECGTEKVYLRDALKGSHPTKSCGCQTSNMISNAVTKHSKSYDKQYKVWINMIQRCHNPNSKSYHNYGAIGITVCEKWQESYENFLEDMGDRPKDKKTIERLDVTKGYNKENCVWADYKTQARNKRKSINMTVDKANEIRAKYQPRVYTQQMLADEYNTTIGTIRSIVQNRSWL